MISDKEVSGPNCERIRNSRDGEKCEWKLNKSYRYSSKGEELRRVNYTELLFDPSMPECLVIRKPQS